MAKPTPVNVTFTPPRIGDNNFQQRQARMAAALAAQHGSTLGTTMRADVHSFGAVIAALSRRSEFAGRIQLAEGRYLLRGALDITASGVELLGTPGQTTIACTEARTTSLLRISGANCAVEGIRFEDAANTAGAAIEFLDGGINGRVRNCHFADCFEGIHVRDAWALLSENLFTGVRSTYAVHLFAGADDTLIQCNRSADGAMYGDDGVNRLGFTGNNIAAAGGISYKGGLGSIGSGLNVGTVTVR